MSAAGRWAETAPGPGLRCWVSQGSDLPGRLTRRRGIKGQEGLLATERPAAPRSRPGDSAETTHLGDRTPSPARREDFRVAVVGDNPAVTLLLRRTLATVPGLHFLGAFSFGRDALTSLSRVQPHLVLIELGAPEVRGVWFAHHLKAANPMLRIAILSTKADPNTVARAAQAGCDGFLTGPFSAAQCLATVQFLRFKTSDHSPLPTPGASVRSHPPQQHNGICPHGRLRDWEVMECLARGLLYKEISSSLNLSLPLVKKAVHRILGELGVRNRTEAANLWLGDRFAGGSSGLKDSASASPSGNSRMRRVVAGRAARLAPALGFQRVT